MNIAKNESLTMLEDAGLNVPKRHVIAADTPQVYAGKRAQIFILENKGASIRTFGKAEWDEPHFPNLGEEEALDKTMHLLSEGYSVILSEPIDPKNNVAACCIIFATDGTIVVEALLGPNKTVRLMRKGQKPDFRYAGEPFEVGRPEIQKIVDTILQSRISPKGKLFEASYYATSHGTKNSKIIFWQMENVNW